MTTGQKIGVWTLAAGAGMVWNGCCELRRLSAWEWRKNDQENIFVGLIFGAIDYGVQSGV